MNSTKFDSAKMEKDKLLAICVKLHEAGVCRRLLSPPEKDAQSYYYDREDVRLYESEILDYDFSTPAELRKKLLQMWDYQPCEYMKEFSAVATIAAFRFKTEECVESAIPAFIYQF